MSNPSEKMMMSTATSNAYTAAPARQPGVLAVFLAWIKRKTAVSADQDVWSGGARGL